MNQAHQSPLEAYKSEVLSLINQGFSLKAVAKVLPIVTSDKSIKRALNRWGIQHSQAEKASFKLDGDEAEITSRPSQNLITPEELLADHGLDIKDWEVSNLIVNKWDAMTSDKATGDNRVVEMRQLKLVCKRKRVISFVFPAAMPVDYISPLIRAPKKVLIRGSKLVVFVGDQQAPYHDTHLHELFTRWLSDVKPDEGVLMGDTVDLPDISRHRDNPEWHVSTQKCINSGYVILRDYVQASNTTSWVKMEGNHDERIRIRLLDYMTNLYGLRPADIPGEEIDAAAYSIRNLLRLDSLGIELIDANGAYTHAQHKVTPFLAARHGWIAKKGSGSTALATLDHLGFSVVVGHSHRQSLVYKTISDIDGKPYTLTAAETGCMCRIEGGLGYAIAPDWVNGFTTAQVWADGKFRLDHATYVDNCLFWRDRRYE